MREARWYQNCIVFLCLAGCGMILLTQPWQYSKIMSLGTMTIALGAGCSLIFRKDLFRNIDGWLFLIMFGGISSLVFVSAFAYSDIIALVCFVELPIFMVVFSKGGYGKFLDIIYVVFFVLAAYYISLRFTSLAFINRGEYGISTIESLTLGIANPNQTSIYLLFMMLILGNAVLHYRQKFVQVSLLVVCFILFCLIIETESRAAIIIAAIYGGWTLFFKKFRILRWHIMLAILMPVVFMLFILLGSAFYSELQIMGESFDTGRVEIFKRMLVNNSLFSVMYGSFSTFRFDNLHNSIVSIFATTGLVTTVAFMAFMYTKCRLICRHTMSIRQNNALGAILLMLIHSSVEAAVFTKGSVYAVMASILYLLAANENYKKAGKR